MNLSIKFAVVGALSALALLACSAGDTTREPESTSVVITGGAPGLTPAATCSVQTESCWNGQPTASTANCCTNSHGAYYGCGDKAVEMCVCLQDDYCCIYDWDGACVQEIEEFGCETATTHDCL